MFRPKLPCQNWHQTINGNSISSASSSLINLGQSIILNVFGCQGERGFPGPPGIQGETGIGLPGPKVDLNCHEIRCSLYSYKHARVFSWSVGWCGVPRQNGSSRASWAWRAGPTGNKLASRRAAWFHFIWCTSLSIRQSVLFLFALKGPQGSQGIPGEKGPAGEGFPGPKVQTSLYTFYCFHCTPVSSFLWLTGREGPGGAKGTQRPSRSRN